jgi:hypothetical protein
MGVDFWWFLGRERDEAAAAMERLFHATVGRVQDELPQGVLAQVAAWREAPHSLKAARPGATRGQVEATENFNRAFDLPLDEPFDELRHRVVHSGSSAEPITLVSADRVPPLASLAYAIGPARVARLPGQFLQFFVPALEIVRFAALVREVFTMSELEERSALKRAMEWLAQHNWLSVGDDHLLEGEVAAQRLLRVLPDAADVAAGEGSSFYSICFCPG